MKNDNKNIEIISTYLAKLNIFDYISLLQNPIKLIWLNFLSGLARGFGVGIGMTLLLALFLYTLHKSVDLPWIGIYIAKIVKIVQMELKK